jgi:hypothetical protein
MKWVILFMLIIQTRIWGQEFLVSDYYSELLTTNQNSSEVYIHYMFGVGEYYVADLNTMEVKPSKYHSLPLFGHFTSKMIYSENDHFHLVDFDRSTDTIFYFSSQLDFDTQGNPFSPQEDLAFLNNYIYSFYDKSLWHIDMDQPHSNGIWSSDTTIIVLENDSLPSNHNVIVEYSIYTTRKDTIYRFPPNINITDWNFDVIRNKLYYATWEFIYPSGPVSKVWIFDRNAQKDSVLYEYPKDSDPKCSVYSAGADITEIKWSRNYDKMAFILVYRLDVSATDIFNYWPDSNKITKVTNGCMHHGKKLHIYWGNDDILVYNDMARYQLFGIKVPPLTSIKDDYKPLIPIEYSLSNYPNPFNSSTTIRYQIHKPGVVTLKVYDILGKELTTLINDNKIEGTYDFSFNAVGLSSGVYIYQLRVNDYVSNKKMILIK